MADAPWYAEFFGEDYVRMYRPFLTPGQTEADIAGIVGLLGLPAGSKILDLCCGQGRHSIPLAALGYEVTGLDLSRTLLNRARVAGRGAGLRVRWVRSDMRDVPFEGEYDAVINIFTAFGYLENEAEDQRALGQVYKALKPGGRLLLEVASRDAAVRRFTPADVTHYQDGLLALQEQTFDLRTSRMQVRVTLIEPDGARREYGQSIRLYTLTELAAMLGAAGLSVESYYGGLDGSALTLDSRRLAIVASKGE
jgi:SAM-dependent methyltransferase